MSMNMDIRKILIAGALAAVVPTASMASVTHRQPGEKATPEQSQQQVEKQQALQGTMGEVGTVPRDTDDFEAGGPITDEAGAAATIAGREAELKISSDPLAGALVAQASTDLKETKSSPVAKIGWGAGFLLLGLGFVAGLRQWAAREVSEAPTVPRASKW